MAQKITGNSSMLIAQKKLCGEIEFLVSKYDLTYPIITYRERINLLGGGQDEGDRCPWDNMEREIVEEFSLPTQRQVRDDFASEEIILAVRNALLTSASPYKDFLSIVPSKGGPKEAMITIDSVYHALINEDLFEDVRGCLKRGERIVNEGLATIVSAGNLKRGEPLTAWSTGQIISDFLDNEIPNPDGIVVVPLKTPIRDSYNSYHRDFEYFE